MKPIFMAVCVGVAGVALGFVLGVAAKKLEDDMDFDLKLKRSDWYGDYE